MIDGSVDNLADANVVWYFQDIFDGGAPWANWEGAITCDADGKNAYAVVAKTRAFKGDLYIYDIDLSAKERLPYPLMSDPKKVSESHDHQPISTMKPNLRELDCGDSRFQMLANADNLLITMDGVGRCKSKSVNFIFNLTKNEWYNFTVATTPLDDRESYEKRMALESKKEKEKYKIIKQRQQFELEKILPENQQTVESLIPMLNHESINIRNQAVQALNRLKGSPDKKLTVPALSQALLKLDSLCTIAEIGSYLRALRAMGKDADLSSKALTKLLDERSEIYQDRRPGEVHALRAYILLTLAKVDKARDAMLYIAEILSSSDKETVSLYTVAAYVAGELGPEARAFTPHLMRALKKDFSDAKIPGDDLYLTYYPDMLDFLGIGRETSARIEAIRALAKIGPGAVEAVPLLEALAKTDPYPKENLPSWKVEAQKALEAIQTNTSPKIKE